MPSGIRRALDAQVDRALAAGPPTRRGEVVYVVSWFITLALAALLPILGRRLSRPPMLG